MTIRTCEFTAYHSDVPEYSASMIEELVDGDDYQSIAVETAKALIRGWYIPDGTDPSDILVFVGQKTWDETSQSYVEDGLWRVLFLTKNLDNGAVSVEFSEKEQHED